MFSLSKFSKQASNQYGQLDPLDLELVQNAVRYRD